MKYSKEVIKQAEELIRSHLKAESEATGMSLEHTSRDEQSNVCAIKAAIVSCEFALTFQRLAAGAYLSTQVLEQIKSYLEEQL